MDQGVVLHTTVPRGSLELRPGEDVHFGGQMARCARPMRRRFVRAVLFGSGLSLGPVLFLRQHQLAWNALALGALGVMAVTTKRRQGTQPCWHELPMLSLRVAAVAMSAVLIAGAAGFSKSLGWLAVLGTAVCWSVIAHTLGLACGAMLPVILLCDEEEMRLLRRVPDLYAMQQFPLRGSEGSPITGDVAFDSVLRYSSPGAVVVLGDGALACPGAHDMICELQKRRVEVKTIDTFAEDFCGRTLLERLDTRWFIIRAPRLSSAPYRAVSRVFDVVLAAAGLILLAPLLPVIAVAIKCDSPGPFLYRQARVGLDGRLFNLLKFRTMYVDAERDGPAFAAVGDSRITPFGRILRRSRLDEVPQLRNVLRGEMSLVGPRPERPEFAAVYHSQIPHYRYREVLRPGLTGWAQITEGYTSDYDGAVRKLERDLYYIKNHGPGLDVRILLGTANTCLRLSGR